MRNLCASLSLLCLSVLILTSCSSVDSLLKKAESTKYSETAAKTKTSGTPNHNSSPAAAASAQPSVKPVVSAAAFKGDIAGKAGKEKLYDFLEGNDKKIVNLDLLLSDEQLEQLNDVDKGKRWYFDLAYPDKDGFNTGGELLIDISKGKTGLRLDGNHLTGQVKITAVSGPHQGLMSINAKPITETAEAKSTANKATPSPSAKTQAGTKPKATL